MSVLFQSVKVDDTCVNGEHFCTFTWEGGAQKEAYQTDQQISDWIQQAPAKVSCTLQDHFSPKRPKLKKQGICVIL